MSTLTDTARAAGKAADHFERTERYECGSEGHIFGSWRILDRMRKYRQCVIPSCQHNDVKQVG